jgi:hypothetical protein
MCASASGYSTTSGNSATSCVRTATSDTPYDRTAGTINPARIAATTAILVVRITISSASGYNGSTADDGTATDRTTSDCCTASNCATTDGAAASCATSVGAAALTPD